MSNGISIAVECLSNESKMGFSQTHQSSVVTLDDGLNLGTPQAIREWLMSSQQAFPVNPSASPESNEAQTTNETCGPQHGIVCALLDPATASLKTFQACLIADTSEPLLMTWPKAGIVCDGKFYQQPKWERRISAIGSGLLPTPTTRDWRSGKASQRTMEKNSRPLNEVVLWRTPSSQLIDPKKSVVKLTGRTPQDPQVGLADQVGGQLNPPWVEWLMGWPIGWTDLKPLGMDKFRQWLEKHGEY